MTLTFEGFSRANAERAAHWHGGDIREGNWTGADWSNAMCGEAGELANVVKKLRRDETGHVGSLDPNRAGLLKALADEMGDVYAYLDLLATYYGVDIAKAIADKFNAVSAREGFTEYV